MKRRKPTLAEQVANHEQSLSFVLMQVTRLIDGRKAKIKAKRAKEMDGRIGNIVAVTIRNSSVYARLEIKSRTCPGDIVRSNAATDFYKVTTELELINASEEGSDDAHVPANEARR